MFVPQVLKRTKSQAGNSQDAVPKTLKTFRPTPSHEQIRQRAYEIYQRGGYTNGRDQEDWYKAELEMFAPHKNLPGIFK